MLEFDAKAFAWMIIGAGGLLAILGIMGMCESSGRCSRMEEQKEEQLKVKNWENTPRRLAMTERKH